MSPSAQIGGALCLLTSLVAVGLAAKQDKQEMETIADVEQPMFADGDGAAGSNTNDSRASLVFSGGYDTDPGGRPMALLPGHSASRPMCFAKRFAAFVPPGEERHPNQSKSARTKQPCCESSRNTA